QKVGLLFKVAAVTEEQRAKSELAALGNCRACRAAHHRAAYLASELTELQPWVLRLRRVGRSMAQQNVGQLVGHDSYDLALGCRRVEHAAVHEHRSAGKSKSVDFLQVHWRERVLVDWLLEFGRGSRHEPVAQLREVG